MAQNTQALSLQKSNGENLNPPYFDPASHHNINQAKVVSIQSEINQEPAEPLPLNNEEPYFLCSPQQTQEELEDKANMRSHQASVSATAAVSLEL